MSDRFGSVVATISRGCAVLYKVLGVGALMTISPAFAVAAPAESPSVRPSPQVTCPVERVDPGFVHAVAPAEPGRGRQPMMRAISAPASGGSRASLKPDGRVSCLRLTPAGRDPAAVGFGERGGQRPPL